MGTRVGRPEAPARAPNSLLTHRRKERRWTEEDVASGLHRVAARLGQSTPGVDGNMVSRWERGNNRPSARYALLLCLLFNLPPREIGLVPTPQLVDEYLKFREMHAVPDLLRPAVPTAPITESINRTRHLTRALMSGIPPSLPRQARPEFDRTVEAFLASSNRVLFVEGSLGTGKTTNCCAIAERLSPKVVVQIHLLHQLDPTSFDLAGSILHYAGLSPSSGDSLRALDELVESSARTWLVLLDGMTDLVQWKALGRQLDIVLSYVVGSHLRFVVTHRPISPLRTFEYPVLNALVHSPRLSGSPKRGGSYRLELWSEAEAEAFWDEARRPRAPAYKGISHSLQQLVRLPLHMRLVHEAITGPTLNPAMEPSQFQLLDTCVRLAIERVAEDVDASLSVLEAIAVDIYHDDYHRRGGSSLVDTRISVLQAAGLVVVHPSSASTTFSHDVFAEYVLARRALTEITTMGTDFGRGALGRLSGLAETSATALGVLELVIMGLVEQSHEAWRSVIDSVLAVSELGSAPLILAILRLQALGCRLLTASDLQSLLKRATKSTDPQLGQQFLRNPVLLEGLNPQVVGRWMLDTLRAFGSELWWEVMTRLRTLAAEDGVVSTILAMADLSNAEEARLVADLVPRVPNRRLIPSHVMAMLRNHPEWQVRATLISSIAEADADEAETKSVVEYYADHKEDYKVRAAAAKSIASKPQNAQSVFRFLRDPSWHVRGAALESLGGWPNPELTAIAEQIAWAELSEAPSDVRAKAWEIRLLTHASTEGSDDSAFHPVLFRMLREARVGSRPMDETTAARLIHLGLESHVGRVRAEAEALRIERSRASAEEPRRTTPQAEFRRLRGRRSIQVALDCTDIERAIRIARAAVTEGVDFVEVGDPLIKRHGVQVIGMIKDHAPSVRVVAEMMSADWGRDQVDLAVAHGADVILLIGPASRSSVQHAVITARRLGVVLLLDVPQHQVSEPWCSLMQEVGVDGLVVTANIDANMHGAYPLSLAAQIRRWTSLPLAVSGGFGELDIHRLAGIADIVIVGRSVVDAVDPEAATRSLCDQVKERLGQPEWPVS